MLCQAQVHQRLLGCLYHTAFVVWISIFSYPHFLSSLTFMNFRCLSLRASEGCLGEMSGGPCAALHLPVKLRRGHPLRTGSSPSAAPSALAQPRDARVPRALPRCSPAFNRRVGLLLALRLPEGGRDDWERRRKTRLQGIREMLLKYMATYR